MDHVYEGRITGTMDYHVLQDGKTLDPTRSLEFVRHSPTGFSWGYLGSGPSQLAFALLLEETSPEFAHANYHTFKESFMAQRMQLDQPWTVTSADIREWTRLRELV